MVSDGVGHALGEECLHGALRSKIAKLYFLL